MRRAAPVGKTWQDPLELAFVAGLSTRENPDELAGHGVGSGGP